VIIATRDPVHHPAENDLSDESGLLLAWRRHQRVNGQAQTRQDNIHGIYKLFTQLSCFDNRFVSDAVLFTEIDAFLVIAEVTLQLLLKSEIQLKFFLL